MNDGFFDESDFFFLCKSTPEKLGAFVDSFALRPNSSSEVLDLLNLGHASQNVQLEWIERLDVVAHVGADFYLLDPSGRHFMICPRPDAYVVFGVPYTLLDRENMLALLRRFEAICGWGWSGEPPPQAIATIEDRAQHPSPIYHRYHCGIMIAGQ